MLFVSGQCCLLALVQCHKDNGWLFAGLRSDIIKEIKHNLSRDITQTEFALLYLECCLSTYLLFVCNTRFHPNLIQVHVFNSIFILEVIPVKNVVFTQEPEICLTVARTLIGSFHIPSFHLYGTAAKNGKVTVSMTVLLGVPFYILHNQYYKYKMTTLGHNVFQPWPNESDLAGLAIVSKLIGE